MADSKETVVFEINVDSTEKALADLTKSINVLSDAREELTKKSKKGDIEAAKSLEQVNSELSLLRKEYKNTLKVLVQYKATQKETTDTVNFMNNSVEKNKFLLSKLIDEYNKAKVPSQKLKDTIFAINDALKRQGTQIGDTRRLVGDYFNKFSSAVPVLGQAVQAGRDIGLAFQTAGGGVKGFTAALATTGLPLIVAGVTALIDVLKEFKPIADAVENSVTGIKAAFGALISGRDIEEAVKQSLELLEVTRDLENTQNAFNISQERYRNEIKRLTIASKDRTKSDQDRLDFIAKANELEQQAFDESVARLDKDLEKRKEIFIEQNKLSEGQFKTLTEGTTKAALNLRARLENTTTFSEKELSVIQDLIKKRSEIEGASLELQERLKNNSNKIQEEILAEKEKRIAAEIALEQKKKTALEAIANENARLEQIRIEATEVGLAKEEKLYELAFEKRFSDLIKAGLTEKQIEELKQRELEEIRKKYAVKGLEFDKEKTAEKIRIAEEAYQKMNDEAVKAQEAQEQSIISSISQISSAVINILSAVSTLINQVADENIERLNEQAKTGAITQKKFAAETRAIRQKAWKESKAIAITQAVMNTANAVMAQLSNPTPYVGIVLAALAAATGAIQIATIAKQKMPKFAKGGKAFDIGGKSHAEGGTPIHVNGEQVAEAEKGEGLFIMKKDAYKDLNMLSGWNQRYGGNSWNTPVKIAADGGMLNIPTSDGGYSTRELSSSVDNALMMRQAIKDGFKEAPAPELSIVELNNRSKSINRSVKISGL